MKIFKSSIGLALAIKLIRNFFALKFLFFTFVFLEILNWFDLSLYFDWFNNHFSNEGLIWFCIIHTILYLRLTNHNFIFDNDQLRIEPSFLKFKSRKEFRYDYIKEVVIKHEKEMSEWDLDWLLFILFPLEYKWVEIKTKSNAEYKILCFGFEYDCWESDNGNLMEDIFYAFADKNIKVKWTQTTDSYYNDMNKKAERMLSVG